MTDLSRRSLLTGLLSSAAVIAAGPVAKVNPMWIMPTRWTRHDTTYLEGLSQSVHQTIVYGINPGYFDRRYVAEDWSYVCHAASNVLNCGELPGASWATHFDVDRTQWPVPAYSQSPT